MRLVRLKWCAHKFRTQRVRPLALVRFGRSNVKRLAVREMRDSGWMVSGRKRVPRGEMGRRSRSGLHGARARSLCVTVRRGRPPRRVSSGGRRNIGRGRVFSGFSSLSTYGPLPGQSGSCWRETGMTWRAWGHCRDAPCGALAARGESSRFAGQEGRQTGPRFEGGAGWSRAPFCPGRSGLSTCAAAVVAAARC